VTLFVKVFVLSWSEKELLSPPLASVIPLVTLLNDPSDQVYKPDVSADQSFTPPPPTIAGVPPPLLPPPLPLTCGRGGRGGAVEQGTSCHSLFGYDAVKHPFFGKGVRTMALRQVSRTSDFAGGCEVCCARLGLAPAIHSKLVAMNERYPRLNIDSPLPGIF
jgi:hypothetical protein